VEGDIIVLDGAVHASSGPSGTFAPGDARFWSSTSGRAHDADDRVIYNTSNGQLSYDADGTGAGLAQLIATLQGAPTLEAGDITIINGSGGGSTIDGTSGNDSLVGTSGNDSINGFGGNDTIDGLAGADTMDGGSGNDLYFVDNPADVIVEAQNAGIDEVRASDSYTLPAWVNNLTLVDQAEAGTGNGIDNAIVGNDAFNVLRGFGGNDTLIGGGVISGETADNFIGGEGNDSMVGGSAGNGFDVFYLVLDTTTSYGNDTIVGAGGFDWVSAEGPATTGIVVDLAAGTITGGHAGSSAVISGIEGVSGTAFADHMTGDGADNEFASADGNDTLNGAGGNDRLAGGNGADTYILADAPGAANADNIVGFETGIDEIRLDGRAMPALGASGDFSENDERFFAGAEAHDASDRVIWDGSTLWYDPDGSGSISQESIGSLQTGAVVATDIEVINGSVVTRPTIEGTAGNDTLAGTSGNDTIHGLGGNDLFLAGGSGGADVIDGGDGFDTIEFADRATSAVVVDFGAGTITGGGRARSALRAWSASSLATSTTA
jgi:Ca2+-binding RTX toxin-like protein